MHGCRGSFFGLSGLCRSELGPFSPEARQLTAHQINVIFSAHNVALY